MPLFGEPSQSSLGSFQLEFDLNESKDDRLCLKKWYFNFLTLKMTLFGELS